MVHKSRTFNITKISDIKELAENLTNITWTPCTGFEIGDYLFLNDSFSENGAQEYAIIKMSTLTQIESFTFSWMSAEKAESSIDAIIKGNYDSVLCISVSPNLDYSKGHCCHLCR